MNNISLTGRITKDPEIKKNNNGGSYCYFTIAVDDGKDKDGNRQTCFVDCITYDKRAEFLANYIKKGYMLAVTGSLHISEKQDEHGNYTKRTTVRAYNVENLQPRQTEQAPAPAPAPVDQNETPVEPITPDNVGALPFEI